MGRAAVRMLLAALVVVSACGADPHRPAGPVAADGLRVGSFDFAESELLAEMYAQVVESTGVPVERLGRVGPREIVSPAMEVDLVDLVPEYLGTALTYAGSTRPEPDTALALAVLDRRLAEDGLAPLRAAPAQDRNVFVVTTSTARAGELRSISDLSGRSADMVFGGPAECRRRPLCLPGLESVYGLRFGSFSPQPSLAFTAEALRRGEIDVGLLFSTAAELEDPALTVLEDDLRLQPAENIVPVVRTTALDRWGAGVARAVDHLSARLSTAQLRALNRRVADGEPMRDVARSWVEQHVTDTPR